MTRSIIVFVVIVGIAILFRTGWRPKLSPNDDKGDTGVPFWNRQWVRFIVGGVALWGGWWYISHYQPEYVWLFWVIAIVVAITTFWNQTLKVIGVILALGVFFLLLGMGSCFTSCGHLFRRYKAEQATASVASRVKLEKHLYRFSDFQDGVIRVKIHLGEVDFYPKGGRIKITPPAPAVPWDDEPGTAMPRIPRPPGVYKVSRISPEAWGVDIWN